MKNAVLMFTGGVLLMVTLLIITAIHERMNYSMELQSNLSLVMEEQINELMTNEEAYVKDSEMFLAEFVENLVATLDGEYSLTVEVLQLDTEKGIFAVKVSADFLYLNGKSGETTCERIVIFNQLQ